MRPAHKWFIVAVAALLGLALLASRPAPFEPSEEPLQPPTPPPETTAINPPTPQTTNFPEAELVSALTDICADHGSASEEQSHDDVRSQIDAFREMKASAVERLAASPSSEHLHAAALLEDDAISRMELLAMAILRNPSDPFPVWSMVRICSDSSELECPLERLEQRLIAMDGQNSESWLRVAANRYAAGDHEAALEAMRYASTASESRIYWPETIEMIERGFAASSDYEFSERADLAFGIAATQLPSYRDATEMCRKQSESSAEWAYLCLAYGELVEDQGRTEITTSIARSMQLLALEGLRELDRADEVRQRIVDYRRRFLDAINDSSVKSERLLFSHPALFSAYLATVRSEGEDAARRQLATESERLLELQPELRCDLR